MGWMEPVNFTISGKSPYYLDSLQLYSRSMSMLLKQAIVALLLLFNFSAIADQVMFLPMGNQSLAARLKLVKEAKKSIFFMTYELFPCDASAKIFIKELVAAKKRGVTVVMLIDDFRIESHQRNGLSAYLKSFGIDFRVYNRFEKNHRNHAKILIVDQSKYIIGGRNTTDRYFGMSSKLNYRDQDVLVVGPSAAQVQAGFNDILKHGSISSRFKSSNAKDFYNNCLRANKRDQQVADYFATSNKVLSGLNIYSCPKVDVAIDNPRFLNGSNSSQIERGAAKEEYMNDMRLRYKKATQQVLNFIKDTKVKLVTENQYYMPLYKLRTVFKNLRKKNKKILVFTNRTSDALAGLDGAMTTLMLKASMCDSEDGQSVVPISGLGSLHVNHKLSYRNAPWRIHTKTAVRDSKDVLIGSFNYDPRSYHTNLESGLVFKNCPSLAKKVENEILSLKEVFDYDSKNCAQCEDELSELNFFDYLHGFFLNNFF